MTSLVVLPSLVALVGSSTLVMLVFVALGAFVVLGWISLRRNVRGIDFDDPGENAAASQPEPQSSRTAESK